MKLVDRNKKSTRKNHIIDPHGNPEFLNNFYSSKDNKKQIKLDFALSKYRSRSESRLRSSGLFVFQTRFLREIQIYGQLNQKQTVRSGQKKRSHKLLIERLRQENVSWYKKCVQSQEVVRKLRERCQNERRKYEEEKYAYKRLMEEMKNAENFQQKRGESEYNGKGNRNELRLSYEEELMTGKIFTSTEEDITLQLESRLCYVKSNTHNK